MANYLHRGLGTPPPPPHFGAAAHTRPEPPAPRRFPRHGLLSLALKLAAVLVGAVLGVTIFQLPAFAVTQVQVQGLRQLPEQRVLQPLDLYGQNILVLPIEAVQATLTIDPWIRRVDIQRSLPGRITIYVEEREPAALWQANGTTYLVDIDGTILDPAGDQTHLPFIRDLDGATPTPGEKKDGSIIALAIALTNVLPQEIGQGAKYFEYLSYGGLVVETHQGKRARFGDAQDFQWKLAVWKAVLKEAEAQKLDAGHVDLRFGDRPFFRAN